MTTTLSMFDLVLRGQKQLTRVLADARELPNALVQLLGLSLAGTMIHGALVGVGASALHTTGDGGLGAHPWLWMPLALSGALLGALCICLPSFYFYTQLSGLDATFRLVTAQALRAQATTSVFLLGTLPFYAAWVLGVRVFGDGSSDASSVVTVGLVLPFVVGLAGVWQVYKGFRDLVEIVPITHKRRGNFLGRMVLCWGGVYSVVAIVALYRLSDFLSHQL